MRRSPLGLIGGRLLAGVFLLLATVPCHAVPAVSEGEALFDRACASCHGAGGNGGRGPSLRRQLTHGSEASAIRAVIINGLPGTGMPKFHFHPDELNLLVPFVRSLSQRGTPELSTEHGGSKVEGRRIYEKSGCADCHKIGAAGSAVGPNLTRVGESRSYEYLKASIVDPSADVPEEYQAITVVTAQGQTIKGLRVNEDAFTLQLRLADQSFTSFDKQALQKETAESSSLMPVYHFNDQDLKNLLAYLASLASHGNASGRPKQERR